MPSAPKVSVIVCAYNAQKYLAATIDSVLDQTFRDFELVIVDDGSTDGTETLVRSYDGRGPIVYHKQANAGFGAARNKAVELARGEWIAIIDHDDVCLPDRLKLQLEAAARHPEVGLVFANSDFFKDDGAVVGHVFDAYDPSGRVIPAGAAAELLLVEGCFVDSETAFFRKADALAAGGFPTRYRYVPDYDFFLRLAERRAIYGIPETVARWRVHPGQLTQTAKDTMIREHILVLKEWADKPSLGARTRRVVEVKLAAYLARAMARPTLRKEFGLLKLASGAARRAPKAILEPDWMLRRLRSRFV
jgi:glycosyltransferase involved in cell wall biosynthesis